MEALLSRGIATAFTAQLQWRNGDLRFVTLCCRQMRRCYWCGATTTKVAVATGPAGVRKHLYRRTDGCIAANAPRVRRRLAVVRKTRNEFEAGRRHIPSSDRPAPAIRGLCVGTGLTTAPMSLGAQT
jgi:hypothetical protein